MPKGYATSFDSQFEDKRDAVALKQIRKNTRGDHVATSKLRASAFDTFWYFTSLPLLPGEATVDPLYAFLLKPLRATLTPRSRVLEGIRKQSPLST